MALRTYDKEWLEELCKDSLSLAEVLRKAGRKQGGGSQNTLKKKIEEYEIDISHFTGQRWQHSPEFQEKYTPENLFIYGTTASNQTLKKYLLQYELLEYKCSECGCDGNWRGHILALQLHHKDGDHRNNKLTNLTFLCPNCHAITDSYGGKNNIGQERVK